MTRAQSSPGTLSSAKMLVSTRLLWSTIGTQVTHISLHSISPILFILESYWRIIFCIVLEGVWSPAPPTHTQGNGGGLWGHRSGVMQFLDTALQAILSHCLAQDNIACDMVEVFWPNSQRNTRECLLFLCCSSLFVVVCWVLQSNILRKKINNFSPSFVSLVCYVWNTHPYLHHTHTPYTFGYLCVCMFSICMTKLYCKLLPCTQKKQKPQVFFIYTVSA